MGWWVKRSPGAEGSGCWLLMAALAAPPLLVALMTRGSFLPRVPVHCYLPYLSYCLDGMRIAFYYYCVDLVSIAVFKPRFLTSSCLGAVVRITAREGIFQRVEGCIL